MDPERFGASLLVLAGVVCGIDMAIAFLVASLRATSDSDDGWSGRD